MVADRLRRTVPALLPILWMAGGCASHPVPAPPADAVVAPSLIIEQFLKAANAQDLDTMARLFGTKDGPEAGRYEKKYVDSRMFALASVLRHDDYSIQGEQIVPGRRDEATQLIVRMRFGERQVDVPFTMVRTKAGSWLIEQIGIQRITGG